jgi:hypothetical protein
VTDKVQYTVCHWPASDAAEFVETTITIQLKATNAGHVELLLDALEAMVLAGIVVPVSMEATGFVKDVQSDEGLGWYRTQRGQG